MCNQDRQARKSGDNDDTEESTARVGAAQAQEELEHRRNKVSTGSNKNE